MCVLLQFVLNVNINPTNGVEDIQINRIIRHAKRQRRSYHHYVGQIWCLSACGRIEMGMEECIIRKTKKYCRICMTGMEIYAWPSTKSFFYLRCLPIEKYLRIRTLGRLNSFNNIGLQLELTRADETGICPRMTFSKYIQSWNVCLKLSEGHCLSESWPHGNMYESVSTSFTSAGSSWNDQFGSTVTNEDWFSLIRQIIYLSVCCH